jgi:hypothetical protein
LADICLGGGYGLDSKAMAARSGQTNSGHPSDMSIALKEIDMQSASLISQALENVNLNLSMAFTKKDRSLAHRREGK